MKTLKFYKESDNRWYVDLPEWTGDKSNLEMVAGADQMLEHISIGNNQVWLKLSEEKFERSEELEFLRLATEYGNGAFYKLEKYNGFEMNTEMWLCDVLKFVFGSFPKTIFFQPQTKEENEHLCTSQMEKSVLNQLDLWIDGCEKQANVFSGSGMEVSAISSQAMCHAYKNVKKLIEEKVQLFNKTSESYIEEVVKKWELILKMDMHKTASSGENIAYGRSVIEEILTDFKNKK